LLLHEAITLLALNDKEVTLFSGVNYSYAIGGAVLAELMLNQRPSVEESRKKSYAFVQDPPPIGDPLLDECLNTVVLLSLVKNAEFLNFLFDKKQLKNHKHRIEQVINGELTGKATQAAIQAMQSAVLVTCIMHAVIVATTAGH
jgi:hypothetical protein